MKRELFFITGLIILLFASFPGRSHALNFGAGITAYYAWWNPAWRDSFDDFKVSPSLMTGPALTLQAENGLSFSGLLLTDKFTGTGFKSEQRESGTGPSGSYIVKTESEYTRFDIDLTMGYQLTDWLKLFCGFKYFESNDEGGRNYEFSYGGSVYKGSSKQGNDMDGMGGGIGLSISRGLAGNLYLILQASALCMKGTAQIIGYIYTGKSMDKMGGFEMTERKENYMIYGGNASATLSYHITSISTSVFLGGRYQYLDWRYDSPGDDPYNMKSDIYYGITAGAIYNF